ncbi:MAG TPA: PAS domain S-box protein, partial [Gammaproteobacteria bacterium]
MSDASPKKPCLIEQPHFSSLLLDTIDSLVAVLDREGRILSFNKACEKATGYSFKEVKGHYVWEFLIPEEQIDAVCDVFSQLKAGDFPNKYENHWIAKDGSKRLISWSNTCLLDENGEVEYVVPTGVDITERKAVEDALRASEERLTFAIKASGQGFYDLNLVTGEAIVSDEYARMLGYEPEEFHETNQKWLERLHPDDRGRFEQYFKDYIAGKKSEYSIEFRQKTKNGSWVDILSMGKVMERDGQGKPLRMLGVQLNITERKHAENELKQSEERFRLLLNSTAEAIYGVDQQGICTFVNLACVEMLGYKSEVDLIGQNMHALIHHTYPDGSVYPKEKCNVRLSTLKGKVTHSDDEVHWRADGSSFPVEYWSHPIYQDGKLAGAVVTFVDVTERKHAEQQMLKLKHAVEQTADSIMITNLQGIIEYVNPAFERISGYIADEVLGKDPSMLKSGKHSDEFYRQVWQQLTAGDIFSDVFINKRRDGSFYYDERTIAPIKNDKGIVTHYVATGRDISDRVESEQQLKYLAHHDILTELPNRVLFLDRLKQALARARWHGRTVAIMFM